MAIDISTDTFKQKIGNPLRLNRFYADFPAIGDGKEGDMAFFLSSASTPVKSIGEIIINWMGKQIKIPGDETVASLTYTFVGDENSDAYKYVNLWINKVVDTTGARGALADVKKDLELHQLDDNGEIKGTWTNKGMFPTEIGEIAFDRDTTDTLATFTVTFALDDYVYNAV